MASESEDALKIKQLGEDINKSIKALEEKVKDGTSALDKVKELDDQLKAVKDNPEKIKDLQDRVDEVIVKMNRPDFGKKAEKSLKDELEEGLSTVLKDKDFGNKRETAKFKMAKGQDEISKAAGLITGANLTDANGPTSANPLYMPSVLLGPNRKVHMRSIISQAPTTSELIRYAQHVSSDGDFAIQVNQGDEKEQIDEKFEMANAVVHTIAAFYRVSKQSLADIPWLTNSLLTKGIERYLKKEDEKVLYGPGGDDDIKGIKEFAPEYEGDMINLYEALLGGVIDLQDSDYDPTGILLRPKNYAQLLTYKTTTGEYNFPMLFMPNQQFPMSIAGVPLLMSTAVKLDDSFIGDWESENARMLIREGLSTEFSYEDDKNFTKNLVTIRIESRIGLMVEEPKAFRYLDLSNIVPAL